MSSLARVGVVLTRWTERWVPDSWVIAVVLTLVVAALAMTVGGATPLESLDAWGKGLWALLALAMQFTLMMVVSYACAVSPPVKRLFVWLASRADATKPHQAILIMGIFSTVTAWLNWAFSLVVCAAFLPFVVQANPRTDFRLLVTSAYLGLGSIWHTGLSGSAPLIIATPDNFLIKAGVLAEVVPTTQTMFSWFNLGYALVAGSLGVIIVALLVPPQEETVTISEAQAQRLADAGLTKSRPAEMAPAERLEWWPGWSIIVSGAMFGYFALQVQQVGLGRAWTIDNYNLVLLALGILLHWYPKSFLLACEEGIRHTWGIVIQYPLYAGIFGLMSYTELGKVLTHFFVQVSSPRLFPVVVYLYSAMLNYFVPSGGSKWIVEASYLIPAGHTLGLSVPTVTLSYAYGDMTTNLLQPFWAIPILAVAGLRFGDIMGYCAIISGMLVLFNILALLLIPLQL
ncbi:MAG: short-chain fatty acid transporter [Candidatus Binatia bacterium]